MLDAVLLLLLCFNSVLDRQDVTQMQELLPVLRILRNSCALAGVCPEWLAGCHAHVHAAQLAVISAQQQQQQQQQLPHLQQESPQPQTSLLPDIHAVVEQHVCSQPSGSRSSVGSCLFPVRLESILRVPLGEGLNGYSS